ncbi:SMP-30/gluconolactonase/LRE family protein [Cellulophaga sp. F20128]|uniref:SMP-30/gluconolactonase/LRE family protein n=1 Tax=Cellulophaga sp. F20128 TaxID=2926413 RepID=UPI001FF4EBB9|nr:SMP-30/gluconolactonase/LRE family protein [Cellulophaga sp. F20128]MCK0158255.1 SMP-30/gluconolactonase/LRE family protein [Cellulophaga sp. F20128]
MKIEIASLWLKTKANLGEGPVYFNDSEELVWLDINNGYVHVSDSISKENKIIYEGEKSSCIISISNEELLVADIDKLIRLNRSTGAITLFLKVDYKSTNIRFNDGKVDPYGNLWIGTMEMNGLLQKGNLYCVEPNKKISIKLKGVSISNGLAWSIDKKTMYFIDTAIRSIYAFDFDNKSKISNQRILVTIPKQFGSPDGMTIDNKGNLWVAMWGGACVLCINPESGLILEKVEVDAPLVTSCVFGGQNMDILFITTAREGLKTKELEKYPYSGSIFSFRTNVNGLKPNRFIINSK